MSKIYEGKKSAIKFELLYIFARLRGLFPDSQKGTLVFGRPDKDIIRQMYYCGGFVPYRIETDSLVTYK